MIKKENIITHFYRELEHFHIIINILEYIDTTSNTKSNTPSPKDGIGTAVVGKTTLETKMSTVDMMVC